MKGAALFALLVLAVFASCSGEETLTDAESLDVARARASLACAVVNDDLNEQCDGLGWVDDDEERASVDRLIAIYRAKPDATYDGLSMREVLQDVASGLDDSKPGVAAELDRALSP